MSSSYIQYVLVDILYLAVQIMSFTIPIPTKDSVKRTNSSITALPISSQMMTVATSPARCGCWLSSSPLCVRVWELRERHQSCPAPHSNYCQPGLTVYKYVRALKCQVSKHVIYNLRWITLLSARYKCTNKALKTCFPVCLWVSVCVCVCISLSAGLSVVLPTDQQFWKHRCSLALREEDEACERECECVGGEGGGWYLTSRSEKSFPNCVCASVCSYEGCSTLKL